MFLKFVIAIPAIIMYLFLFWRQLKDDYPHQTIFTTSFYVLFGIAAFYLLSFFYREDLWFWFSGAGALIGFLISTLKYELKITETLDAAVIATNTIVIAAYFYLGSVAGDIVAYMLTIFHLSLYFLFWFLNENYKKFSWYRSGKIGFAGLVTLGFYFLVRSIVALYFPDMISFIGKEDAMISAFIAFVSFLALYNLSKQTN